MEPSPRLKTEIWVKALIRRCEISGAAAMVVRRGDSGSGVTLIKVNRLDRTADVFTPTRNAEGALIWLRATGLEPAAEETADAYIEKQLKYDPDLWVVEIEDRQGRHFLQEPVGQG